jgi:hypothetical protein
LFNFCIFDRPNFGFHLSYETYIYNPSFSHVTSFYRYKLSFIASDETTEANMFCFDNIAKHIVGKPCSYLLRSAPNTTTIPAEIASIISLKFIFAVGYTQESYWGREKVFLINSIVGAYGRNPHVGLLPPTTPKKPAAITDIQDSPSTAMSKLTTTSSDVRFYTNTDYITLPILILSFCFSPCYYNYYIGKSDANLS